MIATVLRPDSGRLTVGGHTVPVGPRGRAGTAEDMQAGLFDRLRSLPIAPLSAIRYRRS